MSPTRDIDAVIRAKLVIESDLGDALTRAFMDALANVGEITQKTDPAKLNTLRLANTRLVESLSHTQQSLLSFRNEYPHHFMDMKKYVQFKTREIDRIGEQYGEMVGDVLSGLADIITPKKLITALKRIPFMATAVDKFKDLGFDYIGKGLAKTYLTKDYEDNYADFKERRFLSFREKEIAPYLEAARKGKIDWIGDRDYIRSALHKLYEHQYQDPNSMKYGREYSEYFVQVNQKAQELVNLVPKLKGVWGTVFSDKNTAITQYLQSLERGKELTSGLTRGVATLGNTHNASTSNMVAGVGAVNSSWNSLSSQTLGSSGLFPRAMTASQAQAAAVMALMSGDINTFNDIAQMTALGTFGHGGIFPASLDDTYSTFNNVSTNMASLSNTMFSNIGMGIDQTITKLFKGEIEDLDDVWSAVLDSMAQDFMSWVSQISSGFLKDALKEAGGGLINNLMGNQNVYLPSTYGNPYMMMPGQPGFAMPGLGGGGPPDMLGAP